ncbi:MAG: MscL family protein [Thermoanaerobaculia bacterium]
MIGEFKAFLTRSNALALAIGVIIGAATAQLVSAFADDLLMPIIGLIMPGGDWRNAKWVLETATAADGTVTENAILYGHLLGAILDFAIIAFIVFAITKAAIRPDSGLPTKTCPQCLETIPLGASKCRACASVL